MHCGRCGGHVDGTMKIEGPKWMFYCDGGHHVYKGLINDKKFLIEQGILHAGGMPDPRNDARRKAAREQGLRRREEAMYGKQYKEVGSHPFV